MPEMPEVESIRATLAPKLVGRKIVQVKVLLPRLIKYPAAQEYAQLLAGKRIEALTRRGKYLLLHLTDNWLAVVHLRMTGRFCYVPAGEALDKYSKIIFKLDNGADLTFADMRTFGTLYLVREGEENLIKGLHELGAEPLTASFTVQYLYDITRQKKGKIKPFLLDQSNIAGLGNIYVDEALFLAKINPQAVTGTLSLAQIERLHGTIEQVIAKGIADGGTSFRNYVDGNGQKGHHQDDLYVYGQEKKPCRICGTPIVKIKLAGRGTCYCPHCQPLD